MEFFKLETKRLIIRPMSAIDLEDFHQYVSDNEVTKYMYSLSRKDEYPKENSFIYIQLVQNEWKKEDPNFFEFGIELKENNKMIGNICVFFSENKKEAEFGWIFNPKFHKKGFAFEAAKKIIGFIQFEYKIKKIVAHCDERNIASSNLMQRLGFVLYKRNLYRKYPLTGEESTEAEYILKN